MKLIAGCLHEVADETRQILTLWIENIESLYEAESDRNVIPSNGRVAPPVPWF